MKHCSHPLVHGTWGAAAQHDTCVNVFRTNTVPLGTMYWRETTPLRALAGASLGVQRRLAKSRNST